MKHMRKNLLLACLLPAAAAANTGGGAGQGAVTDAEPAAVTAPQAVAPAARVPSAPNVSPAEAAYYEQEAQLARQKRLLDLQVEIMERQERLAGDSKPSTAAAPAAAPIEVSRATLPGARPRQPAGPGFTVVSIWGPDDALQAQILSQGLRITVREGDALTGGWRVRKVARTGLVIEKGRERRNVMIGG